MRSRAHPSTPCAAKPLTAVSLARQFGADSAMAHEGVAVLLRELRRRDYSALKRWKTPGAQAAATDNLPRLLARPAARHGVAADSDAAAALLLALRTYYSLLIGRFLERLAPGSSAVGLGEDSFAAWAVTRSPAVHRFLDELNTAIAQYDVAKPPSGVDGHCDVFKPLYHNLFPRPLRRQLGEYYTPDWLAQHVLDQVGYQGQPAKRLLDPACGSGTFLVMAVRRLRSRAMEEGRPEEPAGLLASLPVGFDVNPLAVMTARANYLLALTDLLPRLGPFQPPVHLRDSVQDRSGQRNFDYVVGNPPWIAWDNLSDKDRRATKPLWQKYGLFSLSGAKARHGGGKKDLSMLMLYAVADRHLKSGGRLGMVITQTLFQTLGAGDGFRRFQLGPDGHPLRVLRVDDLTALKPFGDAANWTSTIVLEKGTPTHYPVPYFRWTEEKVQSGNGKAKRTFQQQPCLAHPIDPAKPTSPWLVEPNGVRHSSTLPHFGPADYRAHLGANSGGANGVYWLEVLSHTPSGLRVRNIAAKGKHAIEVVEQVVEDDLLYPLLRWGGVRRYRAAPDGCILLAQDPLTRSGLNEATMLARWPKTLAYLERFRDLLTARAAYRRYQHSGPFYSMYNVGPYTTAPIKVVWRRMDRRINAAVIETAIVSPRDGNHPRSKPIIPQETCVLVACQSVDEAHYLCAMLNSECVNRLVTAHSVRGGKSFGTPGMMDFLPLRRYRPDDARHRRIAQLSQHAHAALSQSDSLSDSPIEHIQQQIDCQAAALWPV